RIAHAACTQHLNYPFVIPARRSSTAEGLVKRGPRVFAPSSHWVPACAGMTVLSTDRVVHLVFQRVRGSTELRHFLHLQLDVRVDEVVAHHATGLEEV